MAKSRKNTEQFIEESVVIHGDKYDYTLVEYTGTYNKVKIICKEHGIFEQVAKNHTVSKSGCPMCKSKNTLATNMERYGAATFITSAAGKEQVKQTNLSLYGVENAFQNPEIQERQRQTNLERYGYKIVCSSPVIQEKQQQTKLERYGNARYTNREKAKQTMVAKYGFEQAHQVEQFRAKFEATMLERYGVTSAQQNVTIQEQTKQTNLVRYGFVHPRMSKIVQDKQRHTNIHRYGVEYYTQTSDIKEKSAKTNQHKYGVNYARQSHLVDVLPLIEDYNWLFDQYINQDKTATQIAAEVGANGTTIGNYLRYHEIEIKQYFWASYKCQLWLNQQPVEIIPEWKIPGTRFRADGYCEATNTIYEFHGDYWHGNPEIYQPDEINEVVGRTMGELFQKTTERENQIKALGYNLVIVWEHTFQL